MKKLLLALLLIPCVAQAQPVSIFQPPTPIAKLNQTPGAAGSSANGIAVDQFLNQYVKIYGGVAVSTPSAAYATPVPAELTPVAQSVMLPTQVPTLFPVTPNALINTDPLRAVRINNQFNIDMNCSYGAAAATPLPFTVPAQTQHYENFFGNGVKMSGGVSCIKPAAATPASGTLQVWGYK